MRRTRVSDKMKGIINERLGQVTRLEVRPRASRAIGNVVVLHGYRDRLWDLAILIKALSDAGFNVLAYDLPNHGTSIEDEAQRGKIVSFKDYVTTAKIMVWRMLLSRTRGQLPTYIVGYSLGALIATSLMELDPLIQRKIKGLVPVSLPLEFQYTVRPYLRPLKWPIERIIFPLADRFLSDVPVDRLIFTKQSRSLNLPQINKEIAEALGDETDPFYYSGPIVVHMARVFHDAAVGALRGISKITLPVLFVHGRNDAVASLHGVQKAYLRIGSAERDHVLFENVGHDIFKEKPQACLHIVDWLKRRVAADAESPDGATPAA